MSSKDVEREEAVHKLLSLCAENNVSVPENIRAASLGEDIVKELDKEEEQQDESLINSMIKKRAEELASMEEDELFKEIREMWAELKISRPLMECRVTNGSYTVTNAVPETAARIGGDEEEGGPRRAKQHIETVRSAGWMYKYALKMKRIVSGDCRWRPEGSEKVIMEGVNLKFESGKLYLVLGAPGAGKSTLLKIISDSLRQDKMHVVGGDVSINGTSCNDAAVVWSNLTAYIDQIDRLHKYLTVLETCKFAFECRFGGSHAPLALDLGDPEVAQCIEKLDNDLWIVHTVLKGMGLARVNDTFVGDNESVRGVSGGEKKRVTVSEMMCVGAPVLCCDEISTGLDAATTYDIIKLMGAAGRLTSTIKIVSLLQPPPETVALFDELILIDSGSVIYSGPVEEVVSHFESLGYKIPERMDTADWLQALPTVDGAKYLVDDGKEKSHLSTEEFVDAFLSSKHGKAIAESLDTPFKCHTFVNQDTAATKYKNKWTRSLKLLAERELLLWWRDKYKLKARLLQDLIMGIIAGTLFWQQNEDPQSVMGILFQSMFFIALGAMQRIPEQYDVRGVLYKQQDANFFPTWTFVVGRSVAGIPTAVIDAVFYGTIIYFFVGLAHNDGASLGNYFIFLLLVLLASLSTGLIFSIFSSSLPDKNAGQAANVVTLVVLVLFSGFTVQPDVIPNYWIWFYWINMFAWTLRSLAVNEYRSGKYDDPLNNATDVTVGEAILEQFGFTQGGEAFGFEWVWYGVFFLIGVSFISVFISLYFLEALRFDTGKTLAAEYVGEDDVGDETKEAEEEIKLPFQKVDLTFKDIHYTVKASVSDEYLELLKGIDGYLEAGKMTALMGSSGAGKTTLMDVLALRKTSGEITGEVRLNGHLQEPRSFRRCTGYVEQFDVQSAQLTIRETVEFSATLRLDASDPAVTPESRLKFIDQTLDMLELTEIQDLQVGSDLTGGLSFEQNKRLAIAVELVSNPSILFLDEPTSGLDARAAGIVMEGLKRIANTGRAVCATIHQPSIAIFKSFDSLLLLKRGGETVFFGDLGEDSVNLIEYLESYQSTPKIQPGENPATWMLTTIGAGSSSTGEKPFDYAGSYADSKLREDCLLKISESEEGASDDKVVSFPNKYATDKKTQRRTVLQRALKVYWRSPSYNLVRLVVSVLIAVLFGSVYVSQRTPENESDMNSRVTSIFITFLFLAVNAYNTVLTLAEAERNMFYRHKAALMYDQRAVLLAFTLAEIPFILLSSMLFVLPFYFMVGFASSAYKFWLYYLFITLTMGLFTFLGQMMVALTKDSTTAQGFGGVFIGTTSLFAGLLLRPQYVTGFWIWAYWVFPGHYILEGLLTSQFNNDDTPIEPSVGSDYFNFVTEKCQGQSDCTGTAEDWILVSFGGKFIYDHVPWNVLYLCGAIIIAKVVTLYGYAKLNFLAK